MKKGKLDNLIPNLQLIFKISKNKTKAMDAFLSIIPSRTFVQNVIPIKNTVLPEITSKGAGEAFLVKIENKMLLQVTRTL